MPLSLPDITLVLIDGGVASALSRLAIENTLDQITPHDLFVIGDPEIAFGLGRSVATKISSLTDVANILWYTVPPLITTSHFLVIQYDGFVTHSSMWTNEFLKYDYIGAPWPWHRWFQVGNGGFSLRSKRLADFMLANRKRYPLDCLFPEDDLLCRRYGPWLANEFKFRWAPVDVASRFSFEREPHRKSFGFHGIFNFDKVLTPAQLIERKRLANDYVKSKVEWKELGI